MFFGGYFKDFLFLVVHRRENSCFLVAIKGLRCTKIWYTFWYTMPYFLVVFGCEPLIYNGLIVFG